MPIQPRQIPKRSATGPDAPRAVAVIGVTGIGCIFLKKTNAVCPL